MSQSLNTKLQSVRNAYDEFQQKEEEKKIYSIAEKIVSSLKSLIDSNFKYTEVPLKLPFEISWPLKDYNATSRIQKAITIAGLTGIVNIYYGSCRISGAEVVGGLCKKVIRTHNIEIRKQKAAIMPEIRESVKTVFSDFIATLDDFCKNPHEGKISKSSTGGDLTYYGHIHSKEGYNHTPAWNYYFEENLSNLFVRRKIEGIRVFVDNFDVYIYF